MPGQPFRIQPSLPVEAYTTYALNSPKSTHSRPATCAEVECEAHLKGWVTRLPVNSPMCDWITSKTHGRHFTETTALGTGEREFMFPPGQQCFRSSQHVTEVGREPFAIIRGGDWRARTSEPMIVGLPEWVERFAENQQKIKDTHDRGQIDG
jgi:hypothetical protein